MYKCVSVFSCVEVDLEPGTSLAYAVDFPTGTPEFFGGLVVSATLKHLLVVCRKVSTAAL
jgi:hypothetical protein